MKQLVRADVMAQGRRRQSRLQPESVKAEESPGRNLQTSSCHRILGESLPSKLQVQYIETMN
jgi:hypothetical protein